MMRLAPLVSLLLVAPAPAIDIPSMQMVSNGKKSQLCLSRLKEDGSEVLAFMCQRNIVARGCSAFLLVNKRRYELRPFDVSESGLLVLKPKRRIPVDEVNAGGGPVLEVAGCKTSFASQRSVDEDVEKAKAQCSELRRSTVEKRISDLTVGESDRIANCRKLGYW